MCGATIDLIRTPAGKTMPVDAEPRVTVVTDDGRVVTGRTPHWATYPDADSFRKKNTPKVKQ